MSQAVSLYPWAPKPKISGRDILAEVAERHGMTVAQMLAGTRKQKLARARQEAMWLIRQRTTLSFPQIARLMGLKDHTTIVHGVKAHERRREEARRAEAQEKAA